MLNCRLLALILQEEIGFVSPIGLPGIILEAKADSFVPFRECTMLIAIEHTKKRDRKLNCSGPNVGSIWRRKDCAPANMCRERVPNDSR
jgi:hypothetical protein